MQHLCLVWPLFDTSDASQVKMEIEVTPFERTAIGPCKAMTIIMLTTKGDPPCYTHENISPWVMSEPASPLPFQGEH